MRRRGKAPDVAVKGHVLPSPRLTRAAYCLMILPLMALLLLLDGLLYLLFRYGFDHCYGLLCLL